MIARINDEQANQLAPLFARKAADSVRISALLGAYGTGHTFFSIYLQKQKHTILSQLDDTFLLMDYGADHAELAHFMQWSPHFSRLMGAYPSLESIAAFLPGGTLRRYARMTASAPTFSQRSGFKIDRHPSLREVYEVGGSSSSAFDVWYADMSHRIRHGWARAYLIRANGEPASACLVSAESRWAGLISSVATQKTWRGHGFASALIQAACTDLLHCKKSVVLECEFSLCRFYSNLGFLMDCELGTYSNSSLG